MRNMRIFPGRRGPRRRGHASDSPTLGRRDRRAPRVRLRTPGPPRPIPLATKDDPTPKGPPLALTIGAGSDTIVHVPGRQIRTNRAADRQLPHRTGLAGPRPRPQTRPDRCDPHVCTQYKTDSVQGQTKRVLFFLDNSLDGLLVRSRPGRAGAGHAGASGPVFWHNKAEAPRVKQISLIFNKIFGN